MHRLARAVASLLLATVLLGGCSARLPRLFRSDTPAKEPDPQPVLQDEPPPPPPPILVTTLWPSADHYVTYAVTDAGQDPVTVEEELVWDGRRLVATYGGYAYANWIFSDDGVWRPDPKGAGTFLRYLPQTLVDGEAWKQTSGEAEVWFRLRRQAGSCSGWFWAGAPEQCWEVTVLNRGEQTSFVLVSGIGPTLVVSENWVDPAESFEKKATAHRVGDLTEERRAAVLEQLLATPGARAPVTPVTTADFHAVAQAMRAEAGEP